MVTPLSRRPSDQAKPELVVASAGNPRFARTRALPTSHGFGMTKQPDWCSRRKTSTRFEGWNMAGGMTCPASLLRAELLVATVAGASHRLDLVAHGVRVFRFRGGGELLGVALECHHRLLELGVVLPDLRLCLRLPLVLVEPGVLHQPEYHR